MPAGPRSRNLADTLPAHAQRAGQRVHRSSPGGEENPHPTGNNGAGPSAWSRSPPRESLTALPADGGLSVPTASAEERRPYVGQRRGLSCPTKRSSSATRWRRVVALLLEEGLDGRIQVRLRRARLRAHGSCYDVSRAFPLKRDDARPPDRRRRCA
jgi:hypothetical protein